MASRVMHGAYKSEIRLCASLSLGGGRREGSTLVKVCESATVDSGFRVLGEVKALHSDLPRTDLGETGRHISSLPECCIDDIFNFGRVTVGMPHPSEIVPCSDPGVGRAVGGKASANERFPPFTDLQIEARR